MTKEELLAIVNKAKEEKRSLTEEEKQIINQAVEETRANETPSGETSGQTSNNEESQSQSGENQQEEERAVNEQSTEDVENSGATASQEASQERKLDININKKTMEKRYNLMAELRNAMETGKKINLGEVRAYTVTSEGEDVVQTDIYDIWMPLRAKNVLTEAGAKVITGIKNNVQIPLMGKVSCGFAGETDSATDGSGVFTSKKLTPKRITAKYPISLELLAQDSIGVENAIRADISAALYSKLEEVLLGDGAGDDDKPAGIFNGITATTASTFADITGLEATLETNNVEGNIKYIMSPSAKAGLRNMAKSTKSTQLVMENGEVDGTPAISTSNVAGKKFVVGDWSNLVIAAWDNVSIDVVRDTASLANGVVTIVVNAFVDGKIVRPEGFAFGELA